MVFSTIRVENEVAHKSSANGNELNTKTKKKSAILRRKTDFSFSENVLA